MTPDEARLGSADGPVDRSAVPATSVRTDERPAGTDLARFRKRFEQSTVPQSFCDLDGVLTEVNAAFCRLVDRPGTELVGLPVRALNHRSDSGEADAQLAALLRGETSNLQTERILRGPAGRPVPALVDAALLRDDDGRPWAPQRSSRT